jgi:hypothetical protein
MCVDLRLLGSEESSFLYRHWYGELSLVVEVLSDSDTVHHFFYQSGQEKYRVNKAGEKSWWKENDIFAQRTRGIGDHAF